MESRQRAAERRSVGIWVEGRRPSCVVYVSYGVPPSHGEASSTYVLDESQEQYRKSPEVDGELQPAANVAPGKLFAVR